MKYSIFLLIILLFSCSADKNNSSEIRSQQQQKILQSINDNGESGDVIVKQGYGMVSRSIIKILDEDVPLSHCGILVKDTLNNFYIIHSVARQVSDIDGVQKIALKKFINDVNPDDFFLLRYKSNENFRIVDEAKCLLKDKIPFDHKYNLQNDTELYCSEFVYKIFLNTFTDEVFIPKPYGYSKLIYFNDIIKHKNFETVIK